MARSWTEITNEIMTNLYLYGQETKPADLVSDSLIRPGTALDGTKGKEIEIDALSFMLSGPGRYREGRSCARLFGNRATASFAFASVRRATGNGSICPVSARMGQTVVRELFVMIGTVFQ